MAVADLTGVTVLGQCTCSSLSLHGNLCIILPASTDKAQRPLSRFPTDVTTKNSVAGFNLGLVNTSIVLSVLFTWHSVTL